MMVNYNFKKKLTLQIKPTKIPKYLIIFCFICQFLCGIDFGFGRLFRKRARVIVQYYTLALSVIFILIQSVPGILNVCEEKVFLWFNFIEYTLYTIALYKVKYKFFDFAVEINNIITLSSNKNKFLIFMVAIYPPAMLLIKISFMISRFVLTKVSICSSLPIMFNVVHATPCLGLDGIAVVQTVIQLYIYWYVKSLKKYVKKTQGKKIMCLEKLYRTIADCYDKIQPLAASLTFLELLIGVPRLMITLWFMLHYIKTDYGWSSYMTEYVYATHNIVQICLPAIITEMMNAQIDAIKSILNERLMTRIDPLCEAELRRILRYLKVRKLHRRVFRCIPVDARQLIALCSLCTTYFIVIVQFTHLYD